ncbi:MAG: HAD family hydrolase [Candidatus Moraniibacteriota bacterium]|nr:MAG: HAD family hydrolase [Candidatus Moranbacteria bacterium]
MRKKVIIFDMDGVLFDTIPYAEETFLGGHLGVTSEMYKELHSGNFHEEIKKYSHLKKEETEEEVVRRNLAYAEKKKEAPLFEGIDNFLKALHSAGYLLVLNTNAFERNCLPLLERAGIRSLFDFIPTAEISKDKVEKFNLIGEKYDINMGDALFVTDALGDVRDADTAGVPTVAVTWGVHDKTFFEREKHDNLIGIVDTVEELRNYIERG